MYDCQKHYYVIAILSCITSIIVSFVTTLAFTITSNDVNKPVSFRDMRVIRTEITNEFETFKTDVGNSIRSVQTNIGNDIRKIQADVSYDLIKVVEEIKGEV
jgi:hypothetical protein